MFTDRIGNDIRNGGELFYTNLEVLNIFTGITDVPNGHGLHDMRYHLANDYVRKPYHLHST